MHTIEVESLPLAHFTVGVPSLVGEQFDAAFARSFRACYPRAGVRSMHAGSGTVILVERGGEQVDWHEAPSGEGWVVAKGQVFDRDEHDQLSPDRILSSFTREDPSFQRLEGQFALVAYDAKRRTLWALNDQASILHLYYVQAQARTYFTTAPLSLARVLRLGLDPAGLREYIARGQIMCPNTLYGGMRRLSLGEHARLSDSGLTVAQHWSAYHEPQAYRNLAEAVDATSNAMLATVRRYVSAKPVVSDLSGGYDSRLVAAAVARAGAGLAVTVNGHPAHPDVVIGKRVARAAGWQMRHFGDQYTAQMTAELRREAALMSRGELDALAFYLHLVTRPALRLEYQFHFLGGGGELLRSFPWGQEFTGIGRRKSASAERVVRYRLMAGPSLPSRLFAKQFGAMLYDDLLSRTEAIVRQGPGTRTTQQLDAAYLLRLTGHVGGYVSSLHDLMPTVAPLLHRPMIEHAVSLPWTMRLTSGLLRRTIEQLHPEAAAVETTYGAPAGRVKPGTLLMEMRQVWNRAAHLADKIDRVALGGLVGRRLPLSDKSPPSPEPPFRTEEFRTFMEPATLHSRDLYDRRELALLLSEPMAPALVLSRMATLEHVCRELDVQPGAELLTQ